MSDKTCDVDEIREEMEEMGFPHADEYSEAELRVYKAYSDLILMLDDITRELEEKISELSDRSREFDVKIRRRKERKEEG